MEDLKYININDIFTKDQIIDILYQAIGDRSPGSDVDYLDNNFDDMKYNIRLFNTSFAKIPNTSKYIVFFRVLVRFKNPFRPGVDPAVSDVIPGLTGINYFWDHGFSGGIDTTLICTVDDSKYTFISDTKHPDARIFSSNGKLYWHDRSLVRIYEIDIGGLLDGNFITTLVYEYEDIFDSYPYERDAYNGQTNKTIVKFDINNEVIYFDGFFSDAMLFISRQNKDKLLQEFTESKIIEKHNNLEKLIDEKKQISSFASSAKKAGELSADKEKELREKVNVMLAEIKELEKQLDDIIYKRKQLLYYKLPFEGRQFGSFKKIHYLSGYNLFLGGSYDTGKEEDKIKFGKNYGIMPKFSLSTPLVEITHPKFGNIRFGAGHTKIASSTLKKYLSGSPIAKFRDNLYADLEKYYPNQYAIHGYKGKYNIIGEIYCMYFYFITTDWKIYISDSFIPFSLDKHTHDMDYKFALVFPVGLQIENNKITVSGGEGDFYTFFMRYDLNAALNMCKHDATMCDMQNYEFYLDTIKEGKTKMVKRLSEAM